MNEMEKKEKMQDLLAIEALFGFSEEEKAEFESIGSEFPDLVLDSSFEEAAAAIALSAVTKQEAMPESLKSKILADADTHFAAVGSIAEEAAPETEYADNIIDVRSERAGWQWPWLGWAVAGFAGIALIGNIWLTRFDRPEIATNPPAVETPAPVKTAAEQREQLLASAKDVIKAPVSSPADDKSLSGDIVWSNAEQAGYMTFEGLPVNARDKETYQLWIFDETQDEATPIDGGVFDVTEEGKVVIPIDAKIAVKQPKMFAVTVEKPGGVVVSKREKIVALGKV